MSDIFLNDDLPVGEEGQLQSPDDYLIQRRWEGDTSFRGAFLQWSMGWINSCFRPTDVIHNIKHPITGEKRPHVVTRIPSYGEDRIYAKEQALIDLVTEDIVELTERITDLLDTNDWYAAPLPKGRTLWHIPTVYGTDLAGLEDRDVDEGAEAAKGGGTQGHDRRLCAGGDLLPTGEGDGNRSR